MITFSIQCFGVFRKFGDCLSVSVETGSSVLYVKEALTRQLGEEHGPLIAESVMADGRTILPNAYILKDQTPLSILPPVCGG